MDQRLALITPQLTYDGFDQADIIAEAVFEGMALKKQVFAEIDGIAKPGCILASNTSYLDIDEIASATERPEMVLGHHYFSPANVMRLLEIVRGKATGKEVLATSMALAKRMNKVGVLAGNARGFIGNRMLSPYLREAQFLVEEGASVEDVNQALYDFGMAMGPLAMSDLAGLDVGWRVRKEFRHLEKPGVRVPLVADQLVRDGPLRAEDRPRMVEVRRESPAVSRSRNRRTHRAGGARRGNRAAQHRRAKRSWTGASSRW